MLFLYNEVYLDIFDFEFNEIENNFFLSFNNTKNSQILLANINPHSLDKTQKLHNLPMLKSDMHPMNGSKLMRSV